MVEIKWTNPAKNDLKDIIKYLSKDSSKYGNYFLLRILEKIEDLVEFPKIGRIVPEFGDTNLRELIFQKYRIIYKLYEDIIEIVRIIHGSRLLRI